MLKRCTICKIERATDSFHKNKMSKDGFRSDCKLCRKSEQERKVISYNSTTRLCHKCGIEKPIADFYSNRLTCLSCNLKTCHVCNVPKPFTDFDEHKGTCRSCKNALFNLRRKNDPAFKLRKNLSHYIARALADLGAHKDMSFLKAVAYTMQELTQHLEKQFESWMTWDNYGVYRKDTWNDADVSTWTWQLDHIIPQSSLPYASMQDDNFKKCWALDNLRPLSSKQNLMDGVKKSRHQLFSLKRANNSDVHKR